jgi:NAD(P)-dependent dehydrogenase (short-subunit alcohol dehydrogenase family)
MLTKALALDLAEAGIRVNAVGPGIVETPMIKPGVKRFGGVTRELAVALTPLRRFARPEEIASAVLYLASEQARHITGQIVMVDGGFTAGTQIGASWEPAAHAFAGGDAAAADNASEA